MPNTTDNKPSFSKSGAQAKDIAERTRESEKGEWRSAIRQNARSSPLDLFSGGPPASTDPHYAVEGLKGNVAQRMKEQGEAAVKGSFKKGGTVPETGVYKLHEGEHVTAKKETVNLPRKHAKIVIKPGGLHRSLGIPEGQKIPAKRLEAATHSDNPKVAKQANLAKTMKGWHKG